MKYKLFVLLAVILIIIEESIELSYPLRTVVPTDFFSEDQQDQYLWIVFLVIGIGLPLFTLLLSRTVDEWTDRQIIMMIAVGVVDRFFINPYSLLLYLGIAVMLAQFIKRSDYSYLVGIGLLIAGLLIVGLPLLLMTFFSETFMDVAQFQHFIALYQSNDYISYIKENLMTSSVKNIAIMILMILPLLLIGEKVAYLVSYYRWSAVLIASAVLAVGTIIKTLVRLTESTQSFDIIILIGGTSQALAVFIMAALFVKTYRLNSSLVIAGLLLADIMMLLCFTGIGIGQYQSLALSDVLIRSGIISMIIVICLLLFSYFRKSSINT